MINSVIVMGRLTKEIELQETTSKKNVISFTLAVNDPYDKKKADFIDCVAWNNSAVFLAKYAKKGDVISVEGKISTRTYESTSGVSVKKTEIVTNRVQIVSKNYGDSEKQETEDVEETTVKEETHQAHQMSIDEEDKPF
jgi:single-strand DNA-binding protein